MSYAILPSTSRAPAFKSTRELEGSGTLSDDMESGYVTTRPRFTRLRRKFSVTFDNLTEDDNAALDQFEDAIVQGGAGGFYMPSLIPNGRFSIAGAASGSLQGWTLPVSGGWATSAAADPDTGLPSLIIETSSPPDAVHTIAATSAKVIPVVIAGEVYQVNASAKLSNDYGSGSGDASITLSASLLITYSDGSTQTVSAILLNSVATDYVPVTANLTIPASGSGRQVGSAVFSLVGTLTPNAGGDVGATASLGNLLAQFNVSSVEMALTSTPKPYGRMPGTAPLARAVRITKPMQWRDMPYADGQKRYSVTFEVTEI